VTDRRAGRILLAGPLPPPIGGTTLLFERLVAAMQTREDIRTNVVDTSGVRGRGAMAAAALAELRRELLESFSRCDVATLHVSTTGLHVMAPLMTSLARRHGVPLLVRKFGGGDFRGFGWLRRRVVVRALKEVDIYLAETRALVEAGRSAGIRRVEWFPNCRPMARLPDDADRGHESCRRFVFLGHLRRSKGVRELIAAGEELGERATVDIYGLPGYDIDPSEFTRLSFVRYRGSVDPQDVNETLSQYDALVLPSYMEGYPGVVIEAFAAGLPVIATLLPSLAEMVDDSCGVLVPPRDARALAQAMNEFVGDSERYMRLRRGVRTRRVLFDESRWHARFVELVEELAAGRAGRDDDGEEP